MTRALLAVTAGLLLSSLTAAEPLVELEAGSPLTALATGVDFALVALDGELPRAVSRLPNAPTAAGWHCLALYPHTAADVPIMLGFRVRGVPEAGAQVFTVTVDQAAPDAKLVFEQHALTSRNPVVVSPLATVQVLLTDAAGVGEFHLEADGATVAPAQFAKGLASGSHRIDVVASDVLGNSGKAASAMVLVDDLGPLLQWRVLDPPPGVPDGVVGRERAMLEVRAVDDVAGIAMLEVNDGTQRWQAHGDDALRVPAGRQELHWRAEDGVGNSAEGIVPVQRDLDGPVVSLVVDGAPILGDSVQVARGTRLRIEVTDVPAGVARVCMRRPQRHCEALPEQLIALDFGTYRLRVEASDLLGNRTMRDLTVRVRR